MTKKMTIENGESLAQEQEREEGGGGLLVVGNYCHDVLFRDGGIIGNSLGGAASFVSNVLDPLSPLPSRYVSKVGADFAYASQISHPPITSATSPTTLFHAHFSSSANIRSDRVLKRVRACDPISPSDLPACRFNLGLAVGVAGEITPETLARILDICGLVFVDAQSLIRAFGPGDGAVGLVPLRDTGFFRLLPRMGFLKVSGEEAPFVDVEEVRKWCCLLVTNGKEGCRVYWKDGELQVPAFPTVQIDPTGAGDSFLGGFALGILMGLKVHDAALLGNFLGSLTVSQIGIPKFDHRLLQRIKQELDRVTIQCADLKQGREIEVDFTNSDVHEDMRASLTEAAKLICGHTSGCVIDEDEGQQNCNIPFCLG